MKIYQVDAFATQSFEGNPAAIIPLTKWISTETMQKIALENNLSETAFVGPDTEKKGDYYIRWFSPTLEVDLCGHATLASAHVYFSHLGFPKKQLVFNSKSGPLLIQKKKEGYSMDFPIVPMQSIEISPEIKKAFDQEIKEAQGSSFYILILINTEEELINLKPKLAEIVKIDCRGVIVTTQSDGKPYDFISRFFAPQSGINEDPVTGSAHCSLVDFWQKKLNKKTFKARQVSSRGGDLDLEIIGNRVKISGTAVTYLEGKIYF